MLLNWPTLRYHELQSLAWRCPDRFVCLPCGRGSGKSELARRRIVRYLPVKKPWSRPIYFYGLPTYGQAKRVGWKNILDLIPKQWIKTRRDSELHIETIFGSELYVVGLDKPQRVEGEQWDGCVIDESSDIRPKTFDLSILPALEHKQGWCWRIGVPKRYGIGAVEYRTACESDAWTTFQWPSSDILTPEQLAWAMENMDELDFEEQYNASWVTAGGAIFHAYDDVENLNSDRDYNPRKPILVGQDYNVNPMCWVLCQEYKTGVPLHQFNELRIRNTNTPKTLDRLAHMFPDHEAGWIFMGDASAKARKTSAEFTDIAHIRNDKRFDPKTIKYFKNNPSRVNRFAACNALFKNASGERRFTIHPRCKHTRQDLVNRQYKEGTREPDDSGDIGHLTDALGYIIHRRYPIKTRVRTRSTKVYAGG